MEESLDIRLDNQKHSFLAEGAQLVNESDGVSLTYGNQRQHIWTFANALHEASSGSVSKCSCTDPSLPNTTPSPCMHHLLAMTTFVRLHGVPPGQGWNSIFYADDPLWDGQGCGPTSTCCTFNNPPWFCKQLPQSTNTDLEVRLCSINSAYYKNTPIELIEIYVK